MKDLISGETNTLKTAPIKWNELKPRQKARQSHRKIEHKAILGATDWKLSGVTRICEGSNEKLPDEKEGDSGTAA